MTFEEPVALGEAAETDLVDVDRVDLAEHLDEGLRAAGIGRGRRVSQHRRVVRHDALDPFHDIERRADDVGVFAQPERSRHRHWGVSQGAVDGVLTTHVVGGGEEVADRWPPHDQPAPGQRDPEREVRRSARHHLDREVTVGEAVEAREQPRTQTVALTGVKHVGHRPSNLGSRFSRKAATPSR